MTKVGYTDRHTGIAPLQPSVRHLLLNSSASLHGGVGTFTNRLPQANLSYILLPPSSFNTSGLAGIYTSTDTVHKIYSFYELRGARHSEKEEEVIKTPHSRQRISTTVQSQ